MFCGKCGMKLDENAKFCSNCGNSVNLTVVNVKSEPQNEDFSQKISLNDALLKLQGENGKEASERNYDALIKSNEETRKALENEIKTEKSTRTFSLIFDLLLLIFPIYLYSNYDDSKLFSVLIALAIFVGSIIAYIYCSSKVSKAEEKLKEYDKIQSNFKEKMK